MASASGQEFPSGWLERHEQFNKLKDLSYQHIDRAIKLEQEARPQEAIASYETGLLTIDKALQIYLENVPNILWDKYYENVNKMKHTRKEVLSRLTDLQNPPASSAAAMPVVPNAPPSYDEAMSSSVSSLSSDLHDSSASPYAGLSHALGQLKTEIGAAQGSTLYVQEGVRMYFIAPDGQVGSLSSPATLTIAQFEDRTDGEAVIKFYLQVGDWVYPLLPGLSPILHSEFGAFIVPDVHSPVPGSAVGLIMPQDADSSVAEILDDILQGIQQQQEKDRERRASREAPPRPPPPVVAPPAAEATAPTLSSRISQGIMIGAQYLSYGLVKGAEKAGELLNAGTPKVMSKITPDAEPKPIPPTLKKSAKVAKTVTGTAVQVTGYIAGKVGSATLALGRMVAPHVQTQGTRLLSHYGGMSQEDASSKVGGALEVTAGAVEGVSTVYTALENSAKILATSLANNTVQIVKHKYGQPAGEVTDDTLHSVGNAVLATHNASALTAKGIAKRAAKNTGKAVLEDYKPKPPQDHQTLEDIKKERDGEGPSGLK